MSKALAVCAAAAFMMLAGCADGPARSEVAAGYGPIYYDDFYGPYWDGLWGADGAFWFSEGPGRPFHRDLDGHFRREASAGFHPVMESRGFRRRG